MAELIHPALRRLREEAEEDFEGFWARAAEGVPWFRRWERVFEWDYPGFRWFSGGLTNLSYNALDRHVAAGRAGHAALIYHAEHGEQRVLTYAQLLAEVRALARALRGLGVARGDRVAIYMPTSPEAIAAMLACTRIGAVHMVVFAGFGSQALADRVGAAGARVLLTADVAFRRGRAVPLKPIVDAALAALGEASPVRAVAVLRRGGGPVPMTPGRDLEWEEFLAAGAGQDDAHAEMEANEPAFILATSGTTAKPKLAVHTHGAYQVGIVATARWLFGLVPEDVWWSTSDIGWIVGHSHIVYAPLVIGCTTVAYEGALDHPDAETFWRIVAYDRVTGVFTAPTAIRLLMRYGEEPARRHDLSSLRRVFSAGEVLNVPAWEWLQKRVLRDRVPVIDHWWQTETGGPVIGNPWGIGMSAVKPGSAGLPLPGFGAAVVTPDGRPCAPGEKGVVVLTRPFPGLTATLWGEPERYARDYWGRIPERYFTGDAAYADEDGYFFFLGRADEVINIAGHRLGTIEIETALLAHPAVAEAGVTGRPDPLRGEVASAFVVLRQGQEPSDALKEQLLQTVRGQLGPVAVIGDLHFVDLLPKTRSGKIMRRVLKAVVLDRDPGDITTIEDEGSVEEARRAWEEFRRALAR